MHILQVRLIQLSLPLHVHCFFVFCFVLFCFVLCCVVLRCVALRCVALRCVALRCVVFCFVLFCFGDFYRFILSLPSLLSQSLYKSIPALWLLGTRFSRFSRHVWQFVGTCIELELCFRGQNPLYLRFVIVHGFKAKFSVTQKLKIAITGNNNNNR